MGRNCLPGKDGAHTHTDNAKSPNFLAEVGLFAELRFGIYHVYLIGKIFSIKKSTDDLSPLFFERRFRSFKFYLFREISLKQEIKLSMSLFLFLKVFKNLSIL